MAGQLGGDISGLAYDGSGSATPGVLWAVDNGAGALLRLLWNGSAWTTDTANGWSAAGKSLKYLDGTGTPDSEGMTLGGPTSASGVYTATERNNAANGVSRLAILRYDVGGTATTLNATNEWSLTADLPAGAPNLGIEDIALVPDSYLTANGFVDQSTSAAYNPANYPNHGSGIFFVGLESDGMVATGTRSNHADNSYTRVATFFSGFSTGVMALDYEPETKRLWVVCDDTCRPLARRVRDRHVAGPNQGTFSPLHYGTQRRPGNAEPQQRGLRRHAAVRVRGRVKPASGRTTRRPVATHCAPARSAAPLGTRRRWRSPARRPATVVGQTMSAAAATGGASGNAVVLSIAAASAGVCSITGSTVRLDHAGSCVVRAEQAGSDDFGPGSAQQTITGSRRSPRRSPA